MTADDDWLGLDDPQERRNVQGPALVVHEPYGPAELLMAERMHRIGASEACNRQLFTTELDDGSEILEQAAIWQVLMGWENAREPTVLEVEMWQANARGARLAKFWERLKAARAQDDVPSPPAAPTPIDMPMRAARRMASTRSP